MAFESITVEPFEHTHETEQFDDLGKVLEKKFGETGDEYLLLGNVACGGEEFDAIFIKKNAITVIEMKAVSGKIRFVENGPWQCGGRLVKGGRHKNPFRQVKNYRFALLRELQEWEKEGALQPAVPRPWGHVSSMLLFGDEISLEGRIPRGAENWFKIADLGDVAEKLSETESPILDFNDYDFDLFRERFGGHVPNSASNAPNQKDRSEEPVDAPSPAVEAVVPTRIVIDRKAGLSDMVRTLRDQGGGSFRAAEKFTEILQKSCRGENPFDSSLAKQIEAIEDGFRYTFIPGYSLIAIHSHHFLCPVALGTDEFVDRWISINTGVRYVLNADGRVTRVFVNGKGPEDVIITDKCGNLLERVELNLEELVPNAFIREGLLKLNEETGDEEIEAVVGAIGDDSVQSLLSDVLFRLRSGDIESANARLSLWKGEAATIHELSEETDIDPEVNSDNFVDVNGLSPDELEKLLDPERFAEWMIFLHPEQRRIAKETYKNRALLTGVSGSGKTCVLVHRAKYLSEKYPDEQIGVLTLNRSLSRLIDNLVSQLCGKENRGNIKVFAFYDYFQKLVDHFGPKKELKNLLQIATTMPDIGPEVHTTITRANPGTYARDFDPHSGETLEDTWDLFMHENPQARTKFVYFTEALFPKDPHIDPDPYLREEFSLIRSGCLTEKREEEYQALKREGRAITLNKRERRNILELLLLFEETMISGGMIDDLGLTLAVTPHMQSLGDLPSELSFRCLLVDEFQDLSTRDIAVLQKIVPQKEDALFLTGDMVQQVMVKTLSLSKLGFLAGSFDREHITRNYRNSRNILLAANNLILEYGRIAKEQNAEIEVLDPEFAIRETIWPRAVETTPEKEIELAWEWAGDCLATTSAVPWSVCIVTTCPQTISVQKILNKRPNNFPTKAVELTGDYAEKEDTMTVGTMSNVKGFEFSVMIIVGCGAKMLPLPGRTADEHWRDALRLYVAMTRARDQVVMIYSGNASEILETMNEFIEWETITPVESKH
jgi:superfamily I DNA/RNA helicase